MTLQPVTSTKRLREITGRSWPWPVLALILLTILASCSNFKPGTDKVKIPDRANGLIPAMENRILEQLFAQAFAELADLDKNQQLLGSWADPSGQWTLGSIAHQQARLTLQNQWWGHIKNDVDPKYLTDDNRISYRLFQYNTEMSNLRFPFRYHHFYTNPIDGLHLRLTLYLINRHPAESVSDLESYIAGINQGAVMLDDLTTDMQSSQQRGILPPKAMLLASIEQIASLHKGSPLELSAQPNLLMEDFRNKLDKLGLVERERNRLLNLMVVALVDRLGPAYRKLQEYLTGLASAAPASSVAWQLPEGESFYLQQLYYFTGTHQTPESLHAFSLSEVARLQHEIDRLANQGEGAPESFFSDSTEGRQAYLTHAVEIIADTPDKAAQLFSWQPTIDLVIKALEPFRESTAIATSYYPPSTTGNNPGVLYVNLADMGVLARNEMQARIYHDAIPGLHLLYSTSQETDVLPTFRRQGYFPAYYQGWAAYMGKAARSAGFYPDYQSMIGELILERTRACAAALDTGMHWKRWTEAEARNFLAAAHCGTMGQNQVLLLGVLSNPGLAAADLVGQEHFQQLQDKARQILGDAFDIRTYHDYLFHIGPLPWDLLEEVLDVWIKHSADAVHQVN